jgi:hypothetical protein
VPENRLYQHCFAAAIDEVSLLTRTDTAVATTNIDTQSTKQNDKGKTEKGLRIAA